MELARNIRLKIGKSLLDKKAQKIKRKVFYSNISLVKKIGIVWDASQVNDFVCLSKFYQKMNEKNIEVKILGYFSGKILPDQFTAIRYLTCIRREEVNFFYHPLTTDSEEFINNRFDILIDINFQNLLPLRYLSTLSKASFKVGLSASENIEIYDLMMELKKPVDTALYLEQTLHYLEMINATQAKN